MTIDERIEALTARHEALTMNVELMQAVQADMQTAQADIHNTHDKVMEEFKMMLRSQVLMSDTLDKMKVRMAEIAEFQSHSDRRLDALILTVDELMRGRNGGPKSGTPQ